MAIQYAGREFPLDQHPSHRTHSASALQATGRQQLGRIKLHAVKHSLALLRMGKKLPKYVELIGISINFYCCIFLVFNFIYILGILYNLQFHSSVHKILTLFCIPQTYERYQVLPSFRSTITSHLKDILSSKPLIVLFPSNSPSSKPV